MIDPLVAIGGIAGFGTDMANLGFGVEGRRNALRLQREAWAREDSAVQRRTLDLRAAGINPLLAAGQAASSMSPSSMPIPQLGTAGVDKAIAAAQLGLIKDQRSLLMAQRESALAGAERSRVESLVQSYDFDIARNRSLSVKELGSQFSQLQSILGWLEKFLGETTGHNWALPNLLGAELDKSRAAARDKAAAKEMNKRPQKFFGTPVGPGWPGSGYGKSASPGRSMVGRGR